MWGRCDIPFRLHPVRGHLDHPAEQRLQVHPGSRCHLSLPSSPLTRDREWGGGQVAPPEGKDSVLCWASFFDL